MQTEETSGVEVLLAFGVAVRPLPGAAFGVASASGFSNPFRVLAMSFRRLDKHRSCALGVFFGMVGL